MRFMRSAQSTSAKPEAENTGLSNSLYLGCSAYWAFKSSWISVMTPYSAPLRTRLSSWGSSRLTQFSVSFGSRLLSLTRERRPSPCPLAAANSSAMVQNAVGAMMEPSAFFKMCLRRV